VTDGCGAPSLVRRGLPGILGRRGAAA